MIMHQVHGCHYLFYQCRKSASCTHVAAVLHALVALHPTTFNVGNTSSATADDSDDEHAIPVTSLPCQWKCPKKRKESALPISEATFEKHDYKKPVKKKFKTIEQFDPRPPEYRGCVVNELLPKFLNKMQGEQLGISLLLDEHFSKAASSSEPSSHHIPDTPHLLETITAFKKSLEIDDEKAREMERNTRQQRLSPLWFTVRRYRITSSMFGMV